MSFIRLYNEGLFIRPAAFIYLTQGTQTLDESGSQEAVVGGGVQPLGRVPPHPCWLQPPTEWGTTTPNTVWGEVEEGAESMRENIRLKGSRTSGPESSRRQTNWCLGCSVCPSLPPSLVPSVPHSLIPLFPMNGKTREGPLEGGAAHTPFWITHTDNKRTCKICTFVWNLWQTKKKKKCLWFRCERWQGKKRAHCVTLPHLKRPDMTNKVFYDLNIKEVMILAIALLVGACSWRNKRWTQVFRWILCCPWTCNCRENQQSRWFLCCLLLLLLLTFFNIVSPSATSLWWTRSFRWSHSCKCQCGVMERSIAQLQLLSKDVADAARVQSSALCLLGSTAPTPPVSHPPPPNMGTQTANENLIKLTIVVFFTDIFSQFTFFLLHKRFSGNNFTTETVSFVLLPIFQCRTS